MGLQGSNSPAQRHEDRSDCDQKRRNLEAESNDPEMDSNTTDVHIRLHNDNNLFSNEKEKAEFFVRYRGKSYEISDLLKKHPGGRGTLGSFKGLALDKIMTEVPHSDAALHLMEEFVVDNQRKYDDIENLIDWNEPVLGQVGKIADRYWEWVNLPVNRSMRLFKSDFMESLTITPWYMIPIVWIPASILFLFLGIKTNNSADFPYAFPAVLLSVVLGLFNWTILEYVIHRNLFHLKPPANSRTLITLHFVLHGVHHKAPFDDRRLLFPPVPAILVAAIFFKIYSAVLPDAIVYLVASGTMTGYFCYDLMHYYLHHGSPKAESYLYVMKRYHNHHHFSHHDQGFGISSRLWDFVFGSLIKLKQLKKAIVW
ncbi:dihydroceramide fatty acyl 2-hydroxylase FAH2 [Venturia canescens]|uniref:dihydroceramide fatty acyl 2-hydroxylase FAH2 n=1 Tax=Venturia canescens TaxID=32260 RepID=UPI001C9D4427|nr:dihydroceramide fatty acyl 2-hydroxylase FAH2 [Venturia canescens]XP_043267528.1 dihydroceramide fatty acyl 2-hydroxylase FAH2 [Venturia canescens]XP_043267530.1 dihydroceramide fatty acyl 2-hydroxylase FAH2 [Venturia canescens]XP_043267531.1 dihydroceramide fatty acyl 2-hydroxylase FAH2 [Venturia canescens]